MIDTSIYLLAFIYLEFIKLSKSEQDYSKDKQISKSILLDQNN
jgi:hypothetical protein